VQPRGSPACVWDSQEICAPGLQVPAPKAACTWVAEKKKFRRVENWPFW